MPPTISLPSKPRRDDPRPAQRHGLIYFICGNPGLVHYYTVFLECLRGMLDALQDESEGRSSRTVYDIYGRNLLGFSDDDHEPFVRGSNEPWDLNGQIEGIYRDVAAQRVPSSHHRDGTHEQEGRPYDLVILMGHSVGAYISLEIFHLHTKNPILNPYLHLRHGFLLFPTLTHIAASPSGRQVSLLRSIIPRVDDNAHLLAKFLLNCLPYGVVLWIVKNVMGFTEQTARVTADWLKSRDGVWQAIHLGVSELRTICEEKWEEELWRGTTVEDGDEDEDDEEEYHQGDDDAGDGVGGRGRHVANTQKMGELQPEVDKAKLPGLLDATLDELAEGLKAGHFTSLQLTKAYLRRIEQVNDAVHAVVETNPDALAIARSLDEERASGSVRGPLHGIPILVKNNIATKDKLNTTGTAPPFFTHFLQPILSQPISHQHLAGSHLLLHATVPHDAFVIQKLRHAGAVILGKTNMSQWANYRARDYSINGWSSHGGQTLAAYIANQNPSGSSSGSAVAADLGLAWAALGTETDGSIVYPAQRSGVVGVKPTVGLTSRSLVVPISEHQDSVGPMARTVKDAAYLLQAIAGEDPDDKYTAEIPGKIPNYVAACRDTLLGSRIGVPWKAIKEGLEKYPHLASEVEVFKDAVLFMEIVGAYVDEEVDFTSTTEDVRDAEKTIMRADFLGNIASYLSKLESNPGAIHTLADIREETQRHPLEAYPQRDTGIWDDILEHHNWDNTDPRFGPAYERLRQLGGPGGLEGLLTSHQLDAVAMPTSLAAMWAAVSGAPVVTVPMGHHGPAEPVHEDGGMVETGPGVPIGMSFLGARWSEKKLFGMAYGFEQRMRVRGRGPARVVEPTAEMDTGV
ncbi:Putative amidase [Trichoderma ghanense]|uniref:Amidase n=1 Tax=Trichoderma ghanense TaxID=65468 RepID=A0ABY2GX32_9HYPO